MYQKALSLTGTLLLLLGCGIPTSFNFTGVKSQSAIVDKGEHLPFQPGRTFIRGVPQGDDSYSRGFRSGCQTHLSIVGSGVLRLLPEQIDPQQLVSDPIYLRGFNDGASYCWARLDWDGH